MSSLHELMKRIGHMFTHPAVLENALRHRSVGADNNERLEFLGDAVLGFIVAHELYRRYPDAVEGDLSRLRASLVNGDRLAHIAMDLGVSHHLHLGVGERKSGGKKRHSILADALEAIVGAIYIDSDLTTCQRCVLAWYNECVEDWSALIPVKDAKSGLQEWTQAHKRSLPDYQVSVSGEAHAQVFTIICHVEGVKFVTQGG